MYFVLESEEANLIAEPLEKLKEHKVVQKVLAKLDKDLQALRKKHEKVNGTIQKIFPCHY